MNMRAKEDETMFVRELVEQRATIVQSLRTSAALEERESLIHAHDPIRAVGHRMAAEVLLREANRIEKDA